MCHARGDRRAAVWRFFRHPRLSAPASTGGCAGRCEWRLSSAARADSGGGVSRVRAAGCLHGTIGHAVAWAADSVDGAGGAPMHFRWMGADADRGTARGRARRTARHADGAGVGGGVRGSHRRGAHEGGPGSGATSAGRLRSRAAVRRQAFGRPPRPGGRVPRPGPDPGPAARQPKPRTHLAHGRELDGRRRAGDRADRRPGGRRDGGASASKRTGQVRPARPQAATAATERHDHPAGWDQASATARGRRTAVHGAAGRRPGEGRPDQGRGAGAVRRSGVDLGRRILAAGARACPRSGGRRLDADLR